MEKKIEWPELSRKKRGKSSPAAAQSKLKLVGGNPQLSTGSNPRAHLCVSGIRWKVSIFPTQPPSLRSSLLSPSAARSCVPLGDSENR